MGLGESIYLRKAGVSKIDYSKGQKQCFPQQCVQVHTYKWIVHSEVDRNAVLGGSGVALVWLYIHTMYSIMYTVHNVYSTRFGNFDSAITV